MKLMLCLSQSDTIVVSTASVKIARQLRKLGLPDKIKFRLVKIVLHSGEIEVLATSLLDEQQFKAEEFGLFTLGSRNIFFQAQRKVRFRKFYR